MFKNNLSGFETKFEQLDPEKVSKELEIKTMAKEAAATNSPQTDSISLYHHENKILVYVENKAKEANDFVYDKIVVFNKVMSKTLIAINELESLNFIHTRFKDDYNHLFTQVRDDIKHLKETMNERKKDLENFKIANNLDRQENSPSNRFFYIAIILLIFISESFFNAFFFSKGNDLGLLGGLFQSLTISAINLFSAWFGVLIFKKSKVFTLSQNLKKFFMVVFLLLIFAICIIHLLVGHYRDALNINPEEAYLISINSFINNPFNLTDFNSWILVILGIFFFIIQFYDIYKIKDPYPGYTEITKIYEESKKAYEDHKYEVLENAKKLEEKVYKDVKLTTKKSEQIYSEVESIPDLKKRLEGKYLEHNLHLTNLLNYLINEYRSINESFRKNEVPKYFRNNALELTTQIIKFNYIEDKKDINKLKKYIENLAKIEAEALERIEIVSSELKNQSEILNEI